MQISAVIITFNEERNIERCIQSLLPIADEIIVLDSFSTDKTQEICANFPVNFHQREWKGYSSAKNFANNLSKYEWILSIDADEVVDEQLQAEIHSLKASGFSSNNVYSLNRLTNYCGKWIYHSSWYPDVKIRIFSKLNVHWEGEFVHEELALPKAVTVNQLKGHLLHYSYFDREDHLNRANKYSALTAQKMHARGKKASIFKPYLSAIARFVTMYCIKLGFMDGIMGFWIAWISAKSNVFKYKELRRLNRLKS